MDVSIAIKYDGDIEDGVLQGLSCLQNNAFGLSSPWTNVNGRMSDRVYLTGRVS